MKKCLTLILSITLFLSCTNSDSNPEISSGNRNLIKKEFYLEKYIESNTHMLSEYDQNGNVVKRNTIIGRNSGIGIPHYVPSEFTYDIDQRLIETERETFQYDEFGRIKSRYDKKNSTTYEVTYSENLVIVNSFNTRIFKLDEENRIVEFSDDSNLTQGKILKIEYDSFDNIVKMENIPTPLDRWSIKEIVEIEYDQNPNPYYNSYKVWSNTFKIFQFQSPSFRFSWWEMFAYFSKNNVTSYRYTQKPYDINTSTFGNDLPNSESYKISYSYNPAGYPTNINIESIITSEQFPTIFDTELAKLEY